MEKNTRLFMIKSAILVGILLAIAFIFRFPIDYYQIKVLSMNAATRIFSKSDALKVIALAIFFFGLYYRDEIGKIAHKKTNMGLSLLYGFLGFMVISFYYFLRYLANIYHVTEGFYFYLIYAASFISLASSFSLFLISVFSWDYITRFYRHFQKPIIITSIVTVICYFLLMEFQAMWPLFVYWIAIILFKMFYPFYPTYMELNKVPYLDINGFAVSIGAPCSGIESLFLFTAFSVGLFALDRDKLNKPLFLVISILGLIGIYFVNIIRLYLLILTGIYISPTFAVGMFHTNVGWILFVIYFLIYYYVIKKFIYRK